MTIIDSKIDEQVKSFCARVGKDSMLVQGAGGNVSWKEGRVLWVKASGTCLADAKDKNIFVPIQLEHLRQAIVNQDFQVTPKVFSNSKLKPSIETLLHALMPHKVVVHLHAIEILAHLVRANPIPDLKKLLDDTISWSLVDYHKPGEELAKAVAANLLDKPDNDVIFLRNHGVVIGGSSVLDIEIILKKLMTILINPMTNNLGDVGNFKSTPILKLQDYILTTDNEINKLATSQDLSKRLKQEWVLYPDHAVFLGGLASILGDSITLEKLEAMSNNKPAFVFDIGECVYESLKATTAQKAQLRCYYDVLIRQPINEKLVSLSQDSIDELLDWNAEKYRQLQSK